MFAEARRIFFPAVEGRGALLLEDVGAPVPALPDLLTGIAADRRPAAGRHPRRGPRRRRQHPPDHRLRPGRRGGPRAGGAGVHRDHGARHLPRRHHHRRTRHRPAEEGTAAHPARGSGDGPAPPDQAGVRPRRNPQPRRDPRSYDLSHIGGLDCFPRRRSDVSAGGCRASADGCSAARRVGRSRRPVWPGSRPAWRWRPTPVRPGAPTWERHPSAAGRLGRHPGRTRVRAARSRPRRSRGCVQLPEALAASMAAMPAGSSRPAASSSAILILFGRDQPLPGRRGVSSSEVRDSSTPRA